MLRLRWNLYRGGIDRAARQEALARLSESKNRRLRSFLEAQQEMRQSWFALEANRQRVEDLSDSVRFNVETRDAYRQQFDVAQRTLLDVLDAENELFVSSGQLVTSQTNELLASYRVLAVSGMLLSALDVPTPLVLRISIPYFALAAFLVYLLAVKIPLLPVAGWGTPAQAVLPLVLLVVPSMVYVGRLTRTYMLEILQEDYIRTARAKGLREHLVIYRHALRNTLVPLSTSVGIIFGGLLSGTFVVTSLR